MARVGPQRHRKKKIILTHYICKSKNMRIRCYFFEVSGGPRAKILGNTDLNGHRRLYKSPIFFLVIIQLKTVEILTTFFPEINFGVF